jgi:hypothetical protein
MKKAACSFRTANRDARNAATPIAQTGHGFRWRQQIDFSAWDARGRARGGRLIFEL